MISHCLIKIVMSILINKLLNKNAINLVFEIH